MRARIEVEKNLEDLDFGRSDDCRFSDSQSEPTQLGAGKLLWGLQAATISSRSLGLGPVSFNASASHICILLWASLISSALFLYMISVRCLRLLSHVIMSRPPHRHHVSQIHTLR